MRFLVCLIVLSLLSFDSGGAVYPADGYRAERARMVEKIESDVKATSRHIDRTELDPRVMKALGTVPRHEFVPKGQVRSAYENRPLPIGYGQTISQPYIVALMTDLLGLSATDTVLEIGTGSGYQAAILAELAAAVYTIEIITPLAQEAAARLAGLRYATIRTRVGDGYYGWEEHAPFDAIIVTATASHVPPPLIAQLKAGGRMVIPVGSRFQVQQLLLISKDREAQVTVRPILPVRFVPLTGGH